MLIFQKQIQHGNHPTRNNDYLKIHDTTNTNKDDNYLRSILVNTHTWTASRYFCFLGTIVKWKFQSSNSRLDFMCTLFLVDRIVGQSTGRSHIHSNYPCMRSIFDLLFHVI